MRLSLLGLTVLFTSLCHEVTAENREHMTFFGEWLTSYDPNGVVWVNNAEAQYPECYVATDNSTHDTFSVTYSGAGITTIRLSIKPEQNAWIRDGTATLITYIDDQRWELARVQLMDGSKSDIAFVQYIDSEIPTKFFELLAAGEKLALKRPNGRDTITEWSLEGAEAALQDWSNCRVELIQNSPFY